MDIECTWILGQGKIQVANIKLIQWSVRREGGGMLGTVILFIGQFVHPVEKRVGCRESLF